MNDTKQKYLQLSNRHLSINSLLKVLLLFLKHSNIDRKCRQQVEAQNIIKQKIIAV